MADIKKTKPEKDIDLIQRIGSGTYGEVYKARWKATGEIAGVKIINIEPGDDFNIIQQEILIMQQCKHPNIVQYFGSYLRRDKLWIAMEYCGGGSLQDIYHVTGPLNEPQIGAVCTEMLKGLDYMHKQHKLHRDIKGANILLTSEGNVKLADFGVGAQITSTMGKRNSFIGTPYWMAPEVAAVERTGGYDHLCDVWAVGITAIELAECQPPLFELHPMRLNEEAASTMSSPKAQTGALYLISKRNYTPPSVKDKNKWSSSMREFIKHSLTKNPKKRPSCEKLLQHNFCQDRLVRKLLSELLDKFAELKQKKKKYRFKEENTEDEDEDEEIKGENKETDNNQNKDKKTVKRIKSKKDKNRKDRVNLPDKDLQPVKRETEPERKATIKAAVPPPPLPQHDSGSEGMPTLIEAPKRNLPPTPSSPKSSFSSDVGNSSSHPPPPLPPRPSTSDDNASTLKVTQQEKKAAAAPPIPPRVPTVHKRERPPSQLFTQRASANCFSKIFNECPLNITCATSWTHPETKNHHLLFATNEGIYSLNLDDLQSIEMFQIFSRPCTWVYVIKNILVSICGSPAHVYMHNLLSLHGQQNIEQFLPVAKGVAYTTKIPGTSNTQKCCVVHNPYNNQMYLYVGRKDAVLLLQWYEPLQKFMIVRDFEVMLPPSLTIFEPVVMKGSEYPVLCVGAYQLPSGDILIDKLDLENGTPWEMKKDCKRLEVKTFSQLEKDAILVAYDDKVLFVDINGKKLHVQNKLTELLFDYPVESAVCLPGSVLTFNANGIQGKSLSDSQVTAQFTDLSRKYKLLGSDRIVVIETKVPTENHSNLYILASG